MLKLLLIGMLLIPSFKDETFTATAYCLQGTKMANGKYPKYGYVAVDTRVIPLGSRVYISGMGTFIAGDTGGVIKGKIVDIYMNCKNAKIFGRKKVKISYAK